MPSNFAHNEQGNITIIAIKLMLVNTLQLDSQNPKVIIPDSDRESSKSMDPPRQMTDRVLRYGLVRPGYLPGTLMTLSGRAIVTSL